MFSYLQAVSETVDKSIYSRGVKYYLEGRVGKHRELTLDFWREYKVLGTDEYLIEIPLLHLALDPSKFENADQALLESARCNCHYFKEYGVCKHIVAVCASLEKEFNPSIKSNKIGLGGDTESILENIFEVEVDKKTRRWSSLLENYIKSSGSQSPTWFDEVVTEVTKKPDDYKIFLEKLNKQINEGIKSYEIEIKIIGLIKQSLYFGGVFWWIFWQPFFHKLERYNKVKLWESLWKMYVVGMFRSFKVEFLESLKSLSVEIKEEIITILQRDFTHQTQFWVNFAIESKFESWLETRIPDLDPKNLLRVYKILPEHGDEIERYVLKQIKVWSDFLQPGEYGEITDVFKTWERVIGRSEVFEQAVKYIKENHPKKKKLIQEIEK